MLWIGRVGWFPLTHFLYFLCYPCLTLPMRNILLRQLSSLLVESINQCYFLLFGSYLVDNSPPLFSPPFDNPLVDNPHTNTQQNRKIVICQRCPRRLWAYRAYWEYPAQPFDSTIPRPLLPPPDEWAQAYYNRKGEQLYTCLCASCVLDVKEEERKAFWQDWGSWKRVSP